jgi:pantoate--beta-alanine ligase
MTLALVHTAHDFRRACFEARQDGELGLVPTMGFLHAGHQSLIEAAARRCPQVAVTIFVNPTQFGANEDMSRYPRDLEGDLRKCEEAGAKLVFAPHDSSEMYPAGYQTFVEPGPLAQPLDGEKRPGHFRGVCTVVAKLFILSRAEEAFFGEKDFQQLAVIRRMVTDLNLPVEVVGLPTVREPDGLAMSSRNKNLSPDERQRALALSRGLRAARALYDGGERRPEALLAAAREPIAAASTRIDYVEVRDAETLHPISERIDRPAVIATAAFIGKTRLIDNIRLEGT